MKFDSFKSLREYLDSVPAINCGGCGYSAYFIYEFLKHKGKKPEIAFIYDPYNPHYHQNDAALNGEGEEPTSCAHVVIKIGDFCYDSTGIKKWQVVLDRWSDGCNHYHIVDEEFLLKALDNRDEWNSFFDRDQEVPEMEKNTGIYLPKS